MKAKTKKVINANTILIRAQRHFDARGQVMIRRRTGTDLGPIFVLDKETGAVVARGIPNLATLARQADLLKPGEVFT